MNSILVIGPSWVGDMVMAQTLFKAIKALDSTTTIDVLAPDWSKPLLQRMPEVRQAHSMPIAHGELGLKKRFLIAKQLKSYAYDKAIVLPNSWKSALIPWLAKIPKRTGFLGEWRFGLLNDVRILDKKRWPKMIERFASLADQKNALVEPTIQTPCLEIDFTSREQTKLKFLKELEIARPILALCPGAEFGASKRWPEQYYAEVAIQKQKEGWLVVIFGSKNDRDVAANIQKQSNHQCLDLTGKTNLEEAIDLLSLANMVVTNDSGLMHIAAALQKPLVAIYGSTDPGFTPPLGKASKIVRLSLPCSPCFKRECPLKHHHCMQSLLPATVLASIDEAGV